MISPAKYCKFVSETLQNRRLMARIALNVLGHSEQFPVDISELRELSPTNRAFTNGLLSWRVANEPNPHQLEFQALKMIASANLGK